MQPDQDRLRAEINNLRRERDAHQMDESDYTDKVLALIAREVRLGRYDELTKVEVYDDPADTIAYIRNRERELEKGAP